MVGFYFKYGCLILELVFILIGSSCCSVEQNQPIKRQDLVDFHKVEISYHELAYYVRTANAKSESKIESFTQLTNVLKQTFRDLDFVPQDKNPFPTILVKHDYKWLVAWEGAMERESVPLIWTDVKLEHAEVLFLTTRGEVVHMRVQDFRSHLNELLQNGAKVKEGVRANNLQ